MNTRMRQTPAAVLAHRHCNRLVGAGCTLIVTVLLALLCTAAGAQAAVGNGAWTWQNPLPQGNQLIDVAALSATEAWALDASGNLLHTVDAGQSWSVRDTGTFGDLERLAFSDPLHGLAVGADGTILATIDGGATWRLRPSRTESSLHDIAFASSLTAFVVGDEGVALRTNDGGLTWRVLGVLACDDLYSVSVVSASDIWVAGDAGTVLHSTDGGANWSYVWARTISSIAFVQVIDASRGWVQTDEGRLLRTTDGGVTWKDLPSAFFSTNRMRFLSATVGWRVGERGGLQRTTDGGVTWNRQASGTRRGINAASFADGSSGWAVGDAGVMLRTTDGGASWTLDGSGAAVSLAAIDRASDGSLFAVGEPRERSLGTAGPGILATVDGGAVWTPGDIGTTPATDIDFAGAFDGWIVGDAGMILHTTDGGGAWNRETSPVATDLAAVLAIDETNAFAVGAQGTLVATTDGGRSWTPLAAPTDADLRAIDASDSQSLWLIGTVYDEENDEYVSEVWHSVDRGATWEQAFAAPTLLAAMDFADPQNGWIVGGWDETAVYRTTDGGATWKAQDSGAPDGLVAVAAVDARHAWAVGDLGTVVHTHDGGAIWWEENTGAWFDLTDVVFADDQHGWIVGDGGAILTTSTGGVPEDLVGSVTKALAAVTVYRGQQAALRYRVLDPGSTHVAVTIEIAKPGSPAVLRAELGKKPVGVAKSYSFTCTLKRGTYIYSVLASDSAGNTQSVIGTARLTVK